MQVRGLRGCDSGIDYLLNTRVCYCPSTDGMC